jgi:hypothetical protein
LSKVERLRAATEIIFINKMQQLSKELANVLQNVFIGIVPEVEQISHKLGHFTIAKYFFH